MMHNRKYCAEIAQTSVHKKERRLWSSAVQLDIVVINKLVSLSSQEDE
ncbi:hypothetical protein ACJIZ3_019813 [Penstemon smallii]|uniref:Uncharacterized protein n=1 Tax=Penstemon smallii TaxID=265156 RepID=A0ABD3T335_9LAMI